MAKSTNPAAAAAAQGQSPLGASVINAAGNQPAKEAGDVNQEAVKEDAEKIADDANKQSPVNNAGQLKQEDKGAGDFQKPLPNDQGVEGKKEMPQSAPSEFAAPQYLRDNPVQNAEELEAIAEFLKAYRSKGVTSETTKQGAQPVQPEADKVLELHNSRLNEYGAGYVIAQRAQIEQVFTAISWQRLGGDKNTDGWRRVVQTPPEVKALQGK